jgi:hypothetical protein
MKDKSVGTLADNVQEAFRKAVVYEAALRQIAEGRTCGSYEYDSTPTAEEIAKRALVEGR